MIKLKSLLFEADDQSGVTAAGAQPQPVQAPPQPPAEGNPNEYSPTVDFSEFEKTLAQTTETAKNNFQNKLMSVVGNKKVLIRASKGYGQPKKDYTINVTGVSIDFYYERYVVIFKDEKEKEYFLETGMTIKVLGPAEIKTHKSDKSTGKSAQPAAPQVAPPVEKAPNVVTQGI